MAKIKLTKEKYYRDIGVPVLPQEKYDKAVGILRLQLNGVMKAFNMYGMGEMIPAAIDEIVKLAEDFGLAVRGVDKMISLEHIRKKAR